MSENFATVMSTNISQLHVKINSSFHCFSEHCLIHITSYQCQGIHQSGHHLPEIECNAQVSVTYWSALFDYTQILFIQHYAAVNLL